jgi:hypothetical protein
MILGFSPDSLLVKPGRERRDVKGVASGIFQPMTADLIEVLFMAVVASVFLKLIMRLHPEDGEQKDE